MYMYTTIYLYNNFLLLFSIAHGGSPTTNAPPTSTESAVVAIQSHANPDENKGIGYMKPYVCTYLYYIYIYILHVFYYYV